VTARLLDLTREQHATLFPRKRKADGTVINTSKIERVGSGVRTVVRDPKSITGICLHQTACVFGPADRDKAHRRALNVPAHVTAFRDGVYVQSAPLLWFLYHGGALNDRTFGLECEGQYPGLLDDPTTPKREDERSFWGDEPTPLTPVAIECFRAALTHLVTEGRRLGCPIAHVWAHRQSHGGKPSDPGQALWVEVAEWGCRSLGLTARYSDTWRDGKPIPKAWAPGGVGPY